MFIDNKYTRLYFRLCQHAKDHPPVGYTERHHIIPKSLGGSNDSSNLIRLSSKQHFVGHHLLTKMVEDGKMRRRMNYAYWRLCTWRLDGFRATPRSYAKAKELFAESMRNDTERSEKLRQRFKGIPLTEETKRKLSEAGKRFYANGGKNWNAGKTGFTHSDATKQKMSISHTGTKKPKTAEMCRKISEARQREGAFIGDKNPMSNPEYRAKVGASKIGRKRYIGTNGERRMFYPDSAPPGFSMG